MPLPAAVRARRLGPRVPLLQRFGWSSLGAFERLRTRAHRAMAWLFTGAAAGLHRLDDGVLGRKLLKREKESADAAVLKAADRQRRSALDERLEDDSVSNPYAASFLLSPSRGRPSASRAEPRAPTPPRRDLAVRRCVSTPRLALTLSQNAAMAADRCCDRANQPRPRFSSSSTRAAKAAEWSSIRPISSSTSTTSSGWPAARSSATRVLKAGNVDAVLTRLRMGGVRLSATEFRVCRREL